MLIQILIWLNNKFIASNLLDNKLIKRLISIQCTDHVVTIAKGPWSFTIVLCVTIAICIPRWIQPVSRPAFPVLR